MGIDRTKRITFEESAELYTRERYPDELIADIISLSGIPPGGKILEIGCGPGNATISFAQRGYELLAIELGERLAAIAAENCRAFPKVQILNMAFEEWVEETAVFDLVIAADALHWIPPKISYPKTARVLKAGGCAAFFWRVPIETEADWSQEIAALYEHTAPQFVNPDKRFTAEWLVEIIQNNFAASHCFWPVTHQQYFWSRSLTTSQYLNDLRTFSMHHGIDEVAREALYAKIGSVLVKHGGTIEKTESAVLFVATAQEN